jgi:ESS family glutamate:Na+ symporter
MYGLGLLIPGMKSTIYGFNFLLGVLCATIVKFITRCLRKTHLMNREYINNFLLTRLSNFFFDIMIVSGIAAIRLDILEKYWGIAIILGAAGLIVTYAYNRLIAKLLFKEYEEEQFLAMYGMLTGTASTGIILLREVDGDFKTPAADNLVYQNFPAILLGFPMLIIATMAPKNTVLALVIVSAYFVVLNVVLFRSFIFRRRGSKKKK